MPKIETVYCANCGAANQGYLRDDEAVMVLQSDGKYENSAVLGCYSCQKYPTGVDDVWTVEDETVYAPLRKKKLRIEAKVRRDKTRVRKFSHKTKRRKRKYDQ